MSLMKIPIIFRKTTDGGGDDNDENGKNGGSWDQSSYITITV